MIFSATVFTMSLIASLGFATCQLRQKTFKAMQLANDLMCVLDSPSQSILVSKLQCGNKCSSLTGCDYFNVIDQGGATNARTNTCQLFQGKPFFIGKLSGCTAFESASSSCQSIAPAGSSATTLSPLYCCNVLFTGQLETRCLATVYAGKGCSTLTNDTSVSVTCSPATQASLPSTTSVALLPILSIGSRILLQNKVAYGTGTVSFNAGWTAYANGIGQPSMTDNYWIGNEKMYALTSVSKQYRLRVEILRGGSWFYAEYDSFIVGSSSTSYQLNVHGTCSGNAGDAIRTTKLEWNANGRSFSTTDRDNDGCSGFNCAVERGGCGWWFKCCTASAVNADQNSCWTDVPSPTVTCDVIASRMFAQQT